MNYKFDVEHQQPLPRPASASAIRTHGAGSIGGSSSYYNNFRPHLHQHDSWNAKSEWDSSYYDTSTSNSTTLRAKTAPIRPATSYGRYPTYGRPRPAYDDDF